VSLGSTPLGEELIPFLGSLTFLTRRRYLPHSCNIQCMSKTCDHIFDDKLN